jgi:hypothetical protein
MVISLSNQHTKEDFIQALFNRDGIYTRRINNTEIRTRCPFCGDSKSDLYATSFSVNVDPSSERFGHYQCFRASCLTHGVIDSDFMYMIHLDKYEVEKDINKFLSSRNIKINGSYHSRTKKELYNVINTNTNIAEAKRKYINNRLGLNLSYEDLYRFKINLSLTDLLNINEINVPKDKEFYYQKLSDYGISFISAYNDYVIIRDISKSNKLRKRYTNIPIFGKDEAISKAYCIPGKLDIMSPEPVVINISEGAFDILGIYYHLMDRYDYNMVYAAINGSGYLNVIKYILEQGLLCDVNVNIFSDADRSPDYYKKMIINLSPFVNNIRLFYNDIGKDYGVRKEEIKLKEVKKIL